MKNIIFITLLLLSYNSSKSQTLDQDNYTSVISDTNFSINFTNNDDGQSFTAGITGNLTSIKVVVFAEDVLNFCTSGDETVLAMELHSGDGFGGSVLGTSSNVTVVDGYTALTEFIFPSPIPVVSGSMYTFEVNIVTENCSFLYTNLEAVLNGNYLGGVGYNAGLAHTSEILFQTLVNSTLSIDENGLEKITNIYPNPVQGFLYLQNFKALKSIKIYNTLGQLILVTKDEKIDFRKLSKGIYFLKIETSSKKMSKKIIKQ